jgi:hypothetical protein
MYEDSFEWCCDAWKYLVCLSNYLLCSWNSESFISQLLVEIRTWKRYNMSMFFHKNYRYGCYFSNRTGTDWLWVI